MNGETATLVPSSLEAIVAIAMAVVPAVLLVVYYYRKDKMRPEPKGLILWIFVLGIFVTIPTGLIEGLGMVIGRGMRLSSLVRDFYVAFVLAGCVEEFAKLYIVRRFAFNRPAFDEITDGIIYTVVASMGFACFENIVYVWHGGAATAMARAFTAVPMHAFMSGIMGYYIGKARFAPTHEAEHALIHKGLIIAIVLHGVYDFILFSSSTLRAPAMTLAIFPLILGAFIWLKHLLETAQSEDRAIQNTIDSIAMRQARHAARGQ